MTNRRRQTREERVEALKQRLRAVDLHDGLDSIRDAVERDDLEEALALRAPKTAILDHDTRCQTFGAIAEHLRVRTAGTVSEVAAALPEHPGGYVEDHAVYSKALDVTVRQIRQEKVIRKAAKRERKLDRVTQVREPDIYGKGSEHSWFVDVAVARDPGLLDFVGQRTATDMSLGAVSERLSKHAHAVRAAVTRGTKYGRRVEAQLRASVRKEEEHEQRKAVEGAERELRALTTGGGPSVSATAGAAAFVAPAFVMKAWAPFRGVERSFADQCCKDWEMPSYGMNVYIPIFNATDRVAAQVEGTQVAETVPSAELEGAKVELQAGQVTLSQQLLDRGFAGGKFDAVMAAQLGQQLAQEIDRYALNQAITNGEAVAGQSSYSIANLYQDIALGREKLTDTAGTRLRPTHFFTTSDFYSYATRQVDGNQRPYIEARFAPGFPLATGSDDFDSGPSPKWSRFTGTVLPGGVLWFTDDNVPAVGTTSRTQLLVSAPETAVVLLEGDPFPVVMPQTLAGSLEPIVSLRCYVAAITRHKAGTAAISSNAYTTALI